MLQKIKWDITKKVIIQEFEAMKNYSFGGIEIDFEKNTRQLTHNIWLDNGSDEWSKIVVPRTIDKDISTGGLNGEMKKEKVPSGNDKEMQEPMGFF